jgi:hypothetical protein
MITFKEFITEAPDSEHKTAWMSGKELSNHVHKTAIKHIVNSDEHRSLSNHNLAHGGSGDLQYRVHTKNYGGSVNFKSVQAASAKKDKDGYTHHATFDIHKNSAKAQPESHLKTHAEKKLSLPWHTSDEKTKDHERMAAGHKKLNGS